MPVRQIRSSMTVPLRVWMDSILSGGFLGPEAMSACGLPSLPPSRNAAFQKDHQAVHGLGLTLLI